METVQEARIESVMPRRLRDDVVTAMLAAHPYEEPDSPALVDVAHWAAEWTWLPVLQRKVDRAAREAGDTVVTHVSTLVTDPWTFRV
jgi:hypothetical protein